MVKEETTLTMDQNFSSLLTSFLLRLQKTIGILSEKVSGNLHGIWENQE